MQPAHRGGEVVKSKRSQDHQCNEAQPSPSERSMHKADMQSAAEPAAEELDAHHDSCAVQPLFSGVQHSLVCLGRLAGTETAAAEARLAVCFKS